MRKLVSLSMVVTWFAGATAIAAEVLMVGPAGGAGFATVQAAIDAAAPGDVILIRAGAYPGFTMDGKGVALVADSGAAVSVGGFIPNSPDPPLPNVIQNVPVGQSAIVQGITLHGFVLIPGSSGTFWTHALTAKNNSGQVWIERCDSNGIRPLRVEASTAVTILQCDLTAVYPASTIGVEVLASHVTLSGTTVVGAPGRDAAPDPFFGFIQSGTVGGSGLEMSIESSLLLSGSTVRGGQGGKGWFDPFMSVCIEAKDGGAGLVAASSNPSSVVRRIDSTIEGGLPGATGCTPGVPGATMITGNAAIVAWSGQVLTLSVTSPRREGQLGGITIGSGAAGTSVLLLLGAAPSALVLPAGFGTAFVALPWTIAPLGTMSGPTMNFSTITPQLPPGIEGISVPLQIAGCIGAQCVLGGGAMLVVVDSSF